MGTGGGTVPVERVHGYRISAPWSRAAISNLVAQFIQELLLNGSHVVRIH